MKRKAKEDSKDKSEESTDKKTKKQRTEPEITSLINDKKKSKIVSIYALGSNAIGQLGIEGTDNATEPTVIPQLSDINMLDCSCGSFFNLVVEGNKNKKHRHIYGWVL